MATVSRDFATMLDELILADEADRASAATIGRADFLAAMEELQTGGLRVGDRMAAASYGEMASERPSKPAPEAAAKRTAAAPAAPLPSLDPADIRRELGLDGLGDAAGLDAARRRFAFANHPDRVEPRLRQRAEQRMRIANMLVDQAKSVLAPASRRRR